MNNYLNDKQIQVKIVIKKSRSVGMSELLYPTNPLPVMKYRSLGLSTELYANAERSWRFYLSHQNCLANPFNSFLSLTPSSKSKTP